MLGGLFSLALNFALSESTSTVCKKQVRQGATGNKGRRCAMKEAKDICKSLVAGTVRASPTSFVPQSVHCALVQILSYDWGLGASVEGHSAHSSGLDMPRKVRLSSRSRLTGGDVHPPPQTSPSSGIALRHEFCCIAPCIPTGLNSSPPAFLSLHEFPLSYWYSLYSQISYHHVNPYVRLCHWGISSQGTWW